MGNRLSGVRKLKDNLSEVMERPFAFVSEVSGAFREEGGVRKWAEVIERGDENTRVAAKTVINTHRVLDTQEAIKQATVALLLLPP